MVSTHADNFKINPLGYKGTQLRLCARFTTVKNEGESNMLKKLYPKGKTKAFVLSYDDGVLQDVRLVSLINKYGLKATFNLNSYLMETEFQWIHSTGLPIKRLPCSVVKSLYAGHEVASHTRTHPYMENLSEKEIMREMSEDKEALEKLLGFEVNGFAVPFDYYSDLIEVCAKKCGFEYARTSQESLSLGSFRDYHRWQGTVFHLNGMLDQLMAEFLNTTDELSFFQLIGHSYDLDTENMWNKTENIFSQVSSSDDILPMTNIELVRYLKAMNKAEISNTQIVNYSDSDLYFSDGNSTFCLHPNETLKL